jgi:hypothetical protein
MKVISWTFQNFEKSYSLQPKLICTSIFIAKYQHNMMHKINEIYESIQIAIWQQESENRSRSIRNKQTQIPVRNGKGNIESDSNGYNSRRLHFKSRTVMEHGSSCMVLAIPKYVHLGKLYCTHPDIWLGKRLMVYCTECRRTYAEHSRSQKVTRERKKG